MTIETEKNLSRYWYKASVKYKKFRREKRYLGLFEYSPFGRTQAENTVRVAKELIAKFKQEIPDLDPWVVEERLIELEDTLRKQVEEIVKAEMSIEEKLPDSTVKKTTEPAWKKYQL